MTRIVREHYPVDGLPEDVRSAFPDVSHVRLVVEDLRTNEEIVAEFDREIAKGLDDLAAGRTYSVDEVRSRSQGRLGHGYDATE